MSWLSMKSSRSAWNKLIFGEKMPDKDDPQYAERREREMEAGRKTCKWLKLDKAALRIQAFASDSPKLFLTLAFGIVVFCFSYNVFCLIKFSRMVPIKSSNAVNAVEKQMERRNSLVEIANCHDTITSKSFRP